MWEQTKRIFFESLERVLGAIARQLPALLAALLILLVALALAFALRGLVLRVCERIALDRRLREWGFVSAPAEGRASPSALAARLVAWTVLAFGVVAGLSAFDGGSTSALASKLLAYVPHVLVAVVILAVGLAGSRAVERSVLIGAVNMGFHSARLVGLGARWLVVVFAFAVALEHLGVGGQVVPVSFEILFGGIVLALALAIGLGAKDLVARSLERRLPPPRPGPAPREEDQVHHL